MTAGVVPNLGLGGQNFELITNSFDAEYGRRFSGGCDERHHGKLEPMDCTASGLRIPAQTAIWMRRCFLSTPRGYGAQSATSSATPSADPPRSRTGCSGFTDYQGPRASDAGTSGQSGANCQAWHSAAAVFTPSDLNGRSERSIIGRQVC